MRAGASGGGEKPYDVCAVHQTSRQVAQIKLKYGYTSLQDGGHVTKLGNSLPRREEGGPETEGDADQEGGLPSFMAQLEVNSANWRCWEDNSVRA